MKLDYFNTDGVVCFEAIVWDKTGNSQLLSEYYSTRSEASKAVKKFIKNYKGPKVIVPEQCFVRQFDEDGMAIQDYDI